MKFILLMIASLAIVSQAAYASKNWSSLKTSKTYKTSKSFTLYLDDKEFVFPANSKMKLNKVVKDNSIKVYIHSFKTTTCPGVDVESDLELLEIEQSSGISTSVGVNLSRGCKLEIFVDMNEYKTKSILK